MVPHKDPSKLPLTDQIKLLREELSKVIWDISGINVKLRSFTDQFKLIRTDIKDLDKRFDHMDKKFDQQNAKFEKLYKLIIGFSGRVKGQD